jgi:hypothetical protein
MDEEQALALLLRKKNQAHCSQSTRKEMRISCWRNLAFGLRPIGNNVTRRSVSLDGRRSVS